MKNKLLKLFVFLTIIIFNVVVFASTNMNSSSYNYWTTNNSSNMYCGHVGNYMDSNAYVGCFNFGTTYQHKLSQFYFDIRYSIPANKQVTVTLNTATQDLRNNFNKNIVYDYTNNQQLTVLSSSFVSQKQYKIVFKTNSATSRVQIETGNVDDINFVTGVNSINLTNITFDIEDITSTDTNQIINNNNSNTNNIINSANQNTQDIISNQNIQSLTEINNSRNNDNETRCSNAYTYEFVKNKGLSNTGVLSDKDNSYATNDYIFIGSNVSKICINKPDNSVGGYYIIFYDSVKSFVSLGANTATRCVNVPSEAIYFRISSPTALTSLYKNSQCVSRQQETTNAIDNQTGAVTGAISGAISNANENTTSLLNNATRNVIATLNTQRSEFVKTCSNAYDFDIDIGKRILSNNTLVDDLNSYYTPGYIGIGSNVSKIYIKNPNNSTPGYYIIFYDNNRNPIFYESTSTRSVTVPNGAVYFRFSSTSANTFISKNAYCVTYTEITNEKLDNINNSINNSNIDNGLGNGFFSDFQDNQHGLTGIITAPLNAIQSITSSSCVALDVPIPFTNGSVSLPCMTQVYEQNIPSIYNIWKVVSFGVIAYFICIDIFHIVKGFKDPESDKVEVLDL